MNRHPRDPGHFRRRRDAGHRHALAVNGGVDPSLDLGLIRAGRRRRRERPRLKLELGFHMSHLYRTSQVYGSNKNTRNGRASGGDSLPNTPKRDANGPKRRFSGKNGKTFFNFFLRRYLMPCNILRHIRKIFSRFLDIVKRFTTRKAPKIGFSMIPKKQRIRLVVCRLLIIMQPNTNVTMYNYHLCYPLTGNT